MPVARVVRIPEHIDSALSEYCGVVDIRVDAVMLFSLVRFLEVVWVDEDTRWVVNVVKTSRDYVSVWLGQVRVFANGMLISTGMRTPTFAYNLTTGSVEKLVERIEASMHILSAESVVAGGQEQLLLAADIAERLGGVIDGSQPEDEG